MTWLLILVILGIVVTVALWAMFVYIAVREMKAEMPGGSFAPALDAQLADQPGPMKVLLPIDGSEASVAAVQEVAHCPLPPGSTIELLYAIHSRLPVIPDFPPWAVTIAAAHGESIRAQTQHAPEVLAGAATHLQTHQRHATVVTKTVEGAPKQEILREAAVWGADRIVLGSHGRGHAQRAVLGSTASAVAAAAPCTVQIVRPRRAVTGELPGVDADAA
jgi:nucleotide-binding universal stress UspA family protein